MQRTYPERGLGPPGGGGRASFRRPYPIWIKVFEPRNNKEEKEPSSFLPFLISDLQVASSKIQDYNQRQQTTRQSLSQLLLYVLTSYLQQSHHDTGYNR
jgi:hypothetical protein